MQTIQIFEEQFKQYASSLNFLLDIVYSFPDQKSTARGKSGAGRVKYIPREVRTQLSQRESIAMKA